MTVYATLVRLENDSTSKTVYRVDGEHLCLSDALLRLRSLSIVGKSAWIEPFHDGKITPLDSRHFVEVQETSQ